jgi:hypothetical protein
MTMSTEGPLDLEDADAPFVVKPWKDPAALEALEAYRAHCYPELAEELGQWIAAIRAGTPVPGDVGRRNAEHLAARGGSAPAGRRARAARGRTRAPRPPARGRKAPARGTPRRHRGRRR